MIWVEKRVGKTGTKKGRKLQSCERIAQENRESEELRNERISEWISLTELKEKKMKSTDWWLKLLRIDGNWVKNWTERIIIKNNKRSNLTNIYTERKRKLRETTEGDN